MADEESKSRLEDERAEAERRALSTTMLNTALFYAGEPLLWSIIPIGPEKKPLIKWKRHQEVPATPQEIFGWFKRFPVNKLAMVTGFPGPEGRRIWVLDADGPQAVQWAERYAPKTPIQAVTRNGRHYYYLIPEGAEIRNAVNVVGGLGGNIRGVGGYGVIPPSPHSAGRYEWDIYLEGFDFSRPEDWGKAVASLPYFLLSDEWRVDGRRRGGGIDLSGVRERQSLDLSPVAEGERNDTLARLAGGLFHRGKSLEEVMLLARGWNLSNMPPMEPERLEATVRSIALCHERNHGVFVPERLEDTDPLDVVEDEEAAPPTEGIGDVPPEILHPGGWLEEFMGWVAKSSVSSFDLFSLCAGLCLLGALFGQKIMTGTGLRTNLYMVCLAPSGTGKDAPLKAISSLLAHAGAESLLGPDQLASSQALWTTLRERPSLLIALDEVGDLMCAVNKRSDSHKSGLAKDLKKLYTSTDRGSNKGYASKKDLQVPWHCLSVYSTGVPGAFYDNLTVADVTDGFVGRTVTISMNLEATKPKRIAMAEPPKRLVDFVKTFFGMPVSFFDEANTRPAPRVVEMSSDAAACFDEWHDKYLVLQNSCRTDNDGLSSIYARVPENASKVALNIATSRARGIPRRIELDDVLWACRFMDWASARMIKDVKASVAYNPQDALLRRILGIIERCGAVRKETIYKILKECTHKQAEDVVSVIENSGRAVRADCFVNGRMSYVLVGQKSGKEKG